MACHLQFNHMSGLIIYLFFPLLPIVTDIFFGGDILAFGPPSVQASHHFFGRAPVLTLKRPRLCQLYQPNFVSGTTGRGEVLPIFFFWIEHRPSGGPPGCCRHAAIFKGSFKPWLSAAPLFLKVPSNLGCPPRRYF
jgi:hypothetical protein